MKKNIILALALIYAVTGALTAQAATLFFDFGDSSQLVPSSENYNSMTVNPPGTPTIFNAIDSTGAGTGIGVSLSGFFNGSNANGTLSPTGAAAVFHPQATRDNGFGHALAFGGNPLTPEGKIELTGLDTSGNTTYSFTFFGSRMGVTDNRETLYSVHGGTSGSSSLDTASNVSNVALVADILPDANGGIEISITPGPNNNNASRFWYIGAMSIESTTTLVPEPSTIGLLMFSGMAVAITRRKR
jgi:hypothetical protein